MAGYFIPNVVRYQWPDVSFQESTQFFENYKSDFKLARKRMSVFADAAALMDAQPPHSP